MLTGVVLGRPCLVWCSLLWDRDNWLLCFSLLCNVSADSRSLFLLFRLLGVVFGGLCSVVVAVLNHSLIIPVSIQHKSIAGRYRLVRVADGPITTCCRFIKKDSWDLKVILVTSISDNNFDSMLQLISVVAQEWYALHLQGFLTRDHHGTPL